MEKGYVSIPSVTELRKPAIEARTNPLPYNRGGLGWGVKLPPSTAAAKAAGTYFLTVAILLLPLALYAI